MFFKIRVFKNFVNFTGKDLRWSLFLMKLQAAPALNPFKHFADEMVQRWGHLRTNLKKYFF